MHLPPAQSTQPGLAATPQVRVTGKLALDLERDLPSVQPTLSVKQVLHFVQGQFQAQTQH